MAAFVLANVLTMSGAKKTVVDRIEPTDWYVGMKNPQVQLMVYGQGIRDVGEVTTDYPGVRIDSLVRLDSPNYLLIYMNVCEAQPGTMTLTFKGGKVKGKKGETVLYQLKQREMSGDKRMGFTNADVLYMLMPDRFAQGEGHNSSSGRHAQLQGGSHETLFASWRRPERHPRASGLFQGARRDGPLADARPGE